MSMRTWLNYHPARYKHGCRLEVTIYDGVPVLTRVEDEHGFDITKAVPQDDWEEMAGYVDDQILNGWINSDPVEA